MCGCAVTREELASIAKENIDLVKDDDYVTETKINGSKAAFGAPIEYWFEQKDGSLILFFTLPLKSPAKVRTLELAIYDPLYYIDFSFAENDSAVLPPAPASCKLTGPCVHAGTRQDSYCLILFRTPGALSRKYWNERHFGAHACRSRGHSGSRRLYRYPSHHRWCRPRSHF